VQRSGEFYRYQAARWRHQEAAPPAEAPNAVGLSTAIALRSAAEAVLLGGAHAGDCNGPAPGPQVACTRHLDTLEVRRGVLADAVQDAGGQVPRLAT
jgi:hypothetical protein